MKKNYFFTESTLALVVSVAALVVESTVVALTVSVAALAALSALDAEPVEFEQAAKAPIANTNISFFIVVIFCF